MAREIPLTKGKVALVDEADYPMLVQLRWRARFNGFGRLYAVTGSGVYMHRLLMCPPVGMDVDHANGDSLDNRRSNLRICDRSQNNANAFPRGYGKTSRFKGVYRHSRGRWMARLCVGKKRIYLGLYLNEEDAAAAYDRAAREHFESFARVNESRQVSGPVGGVGR